MPCFSDVPQADFAVDLMSLPKKKYHFSAAHLFFFTKNNVMIN